MALVNAETRGVISDAVSDFSPLCAELNPGPLTGEWWEVYVVTAAGLFTVAAPLAPQLPASGLFMANRAGKRLNETLASAQQGIDLNLRGLPIAASWSVSPFNAGLGGFQFSCIAVLSLPVVVTPDLALRFYAVPNPGNLNPGPGAGSWVQLSAQFARRK